MKGVFLATMVAIVLGLLSGCAGDRVAADAPSRVGAAQTLKVMPLGDSITDGIEKQRPGAYRIALTRLLSEAGLHVDFVGSRSNGAGVLADPDHEGHPGWKIGQIQDHAEKWLDTYRPDIVLLHIGTNNLIRNDTQGLHDQLRVLLDTICSRLSANGKLYVATIVPIEINHLQHEVAAYNKILKSVVDQELKAGKPVQLVDMHGALGPGDLRDGIHPTDAGYDAMGRVWFTAIRPLVTR